jgi:hypothetical protein
MGEWDAAWIQWHGLCERSQSDVRIMKEIFSILPPWFYILLAVGVLDALFQYSDYREWRRERRESEEVNE